MLSPQDVKVAQNPPTGWEKDRQAYKRNNELDQKWRKFLRLAAINARNVQEKPVRWQYD
jgi:hypothetical protein